MTHEMDIFFEDLNILIGINFLCCVCTAGFQNLPKAFYYPIQLLTFYLLNLKLLTSFRNAY